MRGYCTEKNSQIKEMMRARQELLQMALEMKPGLEILERSAMHVQGWGLSLQVQLALSLKTC